VLTTPPPRRATRLRVPAAPHARCHQHHVVVLLLLLLVVPPLQSSLGSLRREVQSVKQLGSSAGAPAAGHGLSAQQHAGGHAGLADPLDSLLPGLGMRPLLPHRRYTIASEASGRGEESL
jgi:hypothetical protein